MEIQTHEHGPVSVIRLAGDVAGQGDFEPVRQTLRELIEEGKRDFVINMQNVAQLGPAAKGARVLGAWIAGAREMAAQCGGRIKLAGVGDDLRNALAVSGFDNLLDPRSGWLCLEEDDAISQLMVPGCTAPPLGAVPQWVSKAVIEFPSAEENVTEAAREFSSFLERLHIDADMKFAVQVAFHEAFGNAVRHGNGADPSKCVVAECMANERMLKICITDEGDGFDTATTIALKANPFHDGGHGLNLIQTLMDEVSYNNKGNSVSMVKFCSQSLPQHQHGKDCQQVL
jgi:serine/threonine-protein kinase RsbW